MNNESLEILSNARTDFDAGKIERWQYEAIVKTVMRAEVERKPVIVSAFVQECGDEPIMYVTVAR